MAGYVHKRAARQGRREGMRHGKVTHMSGPKEDNSQYFSMAAGFILVLPFILIGLAVVVLFVGG